MNDPMLNGGTSARGAQPDAFQRDAEPGVRDYAEMVWRRKWMLLLPMAMILVASAVVVYAMPAEYRSTGTILIERQEIPPDLVQSTVTSYAEQRIQVISQRVLTTDNLSRIVRKFDLYADERPEVPMERLLQRMRSKFNVEMVSAVVRDPRTGHRSNAAIAFNVSFDDASPAVAQKVANDLVSLYLEENLRTRTQAAADTARFLEEEVTRLGEQLGDIESRLAEFKRANVGRLPEQQDVNLQLLERAEQQLLETERQMRSLRERKIYLEAARAQIRKQPAAVATTEDGEPLDLDQKLRAAESLYVANSGVYAEDHPDMVRLRRQIDALRTELGGGTDANWIRQEIGRLQAELAASRDRYTDEHPDVQRLEQRIARLEQRLADVSRSGSSDPSGRGSTARSNPVAVELQAEIEAADAELASLAARREQIRKKLESLEQRVIDAPEVERQYASLVRDRDNLLSKYQELKAKQSNARIAESMEEERKGERFSLIEPPQVPQEPIRPDRLKFMALGAFVSVFGGVGTVTVAESMSDAVRGSAGVSRALGAPPISVIPYVRNRRDRRVRVAWIIVAVLVALALVGTALAAMHYFYMPLDVGWFKLLQMVDLQ